MQKLDAKDKLLLAALKLNSRASIVSLARDIDLSRSATHDRMIKLEECGVLQAYTITVNDPELFKTKAVLMVVFKQGFNNITAAKRISKMPGVISTYCISGDVDMLAHIECIDAKGLADLRESISALTAIASVRTYGVLSYLGS